MWEEGWRRKEQREDGKRTEPVGCRNRKQKLIETEGKKEKRGGFIMAEPALRWNLFICSVDRKSRTQHNEMDSSEVHSANEPTCPESSSF